MGPLSPGIKIHTVVTCVLLLIASAVQAQQKTGCACALVDSSWMSQIKDPLNGIKNKLPSDSAFTALKKLQKKKIDTPDVQLSKDRWLQGHVISYNATYISRIEGVYDYGDILQHNLNYTTRVALFKNIPFNVSLFGRYSNSSFFRNYLDFNIDLAGGDLSGIAQRKQQAAMQRTYEAKTQMLQVYLDDQLKQLNNFSSLLQVPDNPDCLNRYIHYKEILANKDIYREKITSGVDSISQAASYVEKYDKAKHTVDSLKLMADSLRNEYKNAEAEIKQLKGESMEDWAGAGNKLSKYNKYLKLLHVDTAVAAAGEYKKFWDGFKKLSLGRSMPNSTELSFQNVSINGINTRYDFGKLFTVLQAGWTDFGLRDFVFNSSKRRINSFVYNVGLGIQSRNKDYLLLSFFGGKQNPVYTGNSTGTTRQNTLGVSVSGQLSWRHLTLKGEIAQSQYAIPTDSGTRKTFRLSDNSNKAYSIAAFSVFPRLALNINAYYKYYGANYYGFNAYRINANNAQWGIQGGKSFFNNALTINAGVKTNDYQNPYVEQVYSGKNTITTLNAIFRKHGWVITVGYIPSYQYVSINDTVYENRYQVINCMTSYSYKLGEIPATSSVMFNRFLNDNSTSAYFYGNSSNIALTQIFNFNKYTSSFNASVIKNNLYSYTVFDGGIQYRIGQKVTLKSGFKINSLKAQEYESKVGGYGGTSWSIPKVGAFSLQVDYNYYPDINYKLYGNTVGTLGFTTSFK
ncbi:hypothetical protein A3860_06890 [Niastella vici]|uniref:Outer membrane protein beta-barrel domain-containing protein n=1 Tax=Niastella vici TaxID=1703345 RepID=A0A1V9FID9_9BACT|nr:hypothetical protein [Niastella vici]OQP58051.1 hypothetical protein A3860_06890 [Niastella vici]